ncbi:energy transducer TonB [Draconibacterium sp. IB214405]|uniref:energy transducer TonB n=1 Tax=Draconibacterium sp. IB214405 TaxID=3097352 RepID=UPI002A0D85AD|nr:energy transducer TonB [Draconibacterium sp. IB214405]MDX8339563.1 energy transducer TonB [Draconibacterium sp. IB214405]
MEVKKVQNADLEGKRNTFFLIGLVIALGTTLVAFEWTTAPAKADSLGVIQSLEVEEEIIPITREAEVKPPPPPPPPQVVEVLNIVDDDIEIEDELMIEDSEADDETVIDVQPIIESTEEEEEVDEIFVIVEEAPEFPGGTRALYQYINSHVRYPVIAQENGIQGKVYIKFVVDESGNVADAEVLRPVETSLDKEALRVINSLPRFKPGKQRGKPVKVYYNAQITFKLQ